MYAYWGAAAYSVLGAAWDFSAVYAASGSLTRHILSIFFISAKTRLPGTRLPSLCRGGLCLKKYHKIAAVSRQGRNVCFTGFISFAGLDIKVGGDKT